MSGQDRLELIALLAHIADTGSLSDAAEKAGISQPSASRWLKRLEELVQVRLVERTTHEVTLTPSGLRFLAATRRLNATWQDALEELRYDREDLAGPLRIVMPVVAGQELVASILARFARRHPDVTIDCRLSDADINPTPEADLWIRIGDLPTETLIARELWHIGCAVVAASGHPTLDHPGELADKGAVRIATCVPEMVRLIRTDGKQVVLRQSTTFQVDNVFVARAAIREGVGYGILPLWSVQADLRSGALVHVCPDWSPPIVVLSLAYPPGRHRPRRLVALLDFIKMEFTRAGGLGIEFIETFNAQKSIYVLPVNGPAQNA